MKTCNKLIKNKNFLGLVSKCKKKLRNSVLKNCSKEEIHSIIECILNVYNGNLQISPDLVQKLKPFKKSFDKLLDKKVNIKTKRDILVQKGGFLQILIPAITSALASVISEVVFKK